MKWSKGRLAFWLAWLWLVAAFPLLAAAGETSSSAKVAPSISTAGQPGETMADWQARLELARLLSYQKKYAEAATEYEKVLREKPDSVEAKTELGQVLFWSGKRAEALEILEQVPLEKMDDLTRTVLADLYRAQKRYDRAEALYRAYLDEHPEEWGIRLKLAELLSWSKQYRESLDQYELILQARPDDVQVRRKYALVLSWAGRKAEAIKELRKTLGK
ncbi:MAG: tetratricopeptide repeat protein [Desulfobacca sp.]|nr:tetratricopeptide repeat protein [Desulfobacca sp.]